MCWLAVSLSRTQFLVVQGGRTEIADGSRQRIEECLDDFVVGIVKLAEQDQQRRLQREEEERQRLEERRSCEEAERRRAEEAARFKALEGQVLAWRTASDIRAFVEAARVAEPDASVERAAYFEWALACADELDPLIRQSERSDTKP